MTETEREDWENKKAWLPKEHADQWTEQVREAWLRRRRAYKAWKRTGTPPSVTKGSTREDGSKRPQWVTNDEYIAYQLTNEMWLEVEPEYIKQMRPEND